MISSDLIILDHCFNLGTAPFGFAVACANPDFSPQGLKGKTPFADSRHDRTAFDTPADTYLFEIIN